jgi:glycosyltransferase involved in cell wall biosynthesis
MRLVIVNRLGDYSGGSKHTRKVSEKLLNYFDVTFVPYADFYLNHSEESLKNLESKGFKVHPSAYERITIKQSLFPRPISFYEEYVKRYRNLDADFIYDPDFVSPEAILLSNLTGIPVAVTLNHTIYTLYESVFYTYYSLQGFLTRSFDYFLGRTVWLYTISNQKVKNIRRAKNLRFVGAVSKGILDSIKVNFNKKLIHPGNGVDFFAEPKDKDDYVVFWTTLIPSKGIFSLLRLLKTLKDEGISLKVKVAGKFLYPRFQKMFFEYAKRKGLEVEYMGFLEKDNELRDIVSRAKLLIYPSLADGFSLVVLEALALGTPVIAYSIPTIYSVYKDLPAVRFAKPGNVKEMASLVKRSLNDEEFLNSPKLKEVKEFVKFHNWDNVAEAITKLIKESI